MCSRPGETVPHTQETHRSQNHQSRHTTQHNSHKTQDMCLCVHHTLHTATAKAQSPLGQPSAGLRANQSPLSNELLRFSTHTNQEVFPTQTNSLASRAHSARVPATCAGSAALSTGITGEAGLRVRLCHQLRRMARARRCSRRPCSRRQFVRGRQQAARDQSAESIWAGGIHSAY